MKRKILSVLLILTFAVCSVNALDGFSFFAGLGYDVRGVSKLGDSSHTVDIELGAKYPIGEGFNVYTDIGFRFGGGGKFSNLKIEKGVSGFNVRAGVLYGMRFVQNPSLETYLGGGLSFASTNSSTKGKYFTNTGIGFKLVLAYRINDSLALTIQDLPDIYILNRNKFELGVANTATVGAMFKF